jgi:hypothetical protein
MEEYNEADREMSGMGGKPPVRRVLVLWTCKAANRSVGKKAESELSYRNVYYIMIIMNFIMITGESINLDYIL